MTEAIHDQVLSLPMGPRLVLDDVYEVISKCNK
ncbi:hypothetical protein [Oceanisphaera sp. IT1-181]|nr:hypothetical protein [Oceanisphaera sp. IT1-181]